MGRQRRIALLEQQGEVGSATGVQQLLAVQRGHWLQCVGLPVGKGAARTACQGSGFACSVNLLGLTGTTHLSWKGTGRLWCLGCSADLRLW